MRRKLGRTLVTGASGFIGRAITKALKQRGEDAFYSGKEDLNLLNSGDVKAFSDTDKFETVIHLASRGVYANPNEKSLITDERTMAESALNFVKPGGMLFYAGSVSEYGISGTNRESSKCNPQNAYGRAKLTAGLFLREVAKSREVRVCVGRVHGAYGPGEPRSRLFPSLLNALMRGETIDLSDGMQIRDFIHVDEVAKACIDLVSLEDCPVCINIGTGVGVKVRDAVTRIAKELGAKEELLRFGARERSCHDMDELVADTSLLKSTLHWLPQQYFCRKIDLLPLIY